MAADARVVVEELNRLRRLSDRLLLLAAAEDPDFLHKKPIEVEPVDALVENAVKHTTPDDWIELSVRRNRGVEISVADSGAGIPAKDLERIFERFGRSDASRKGGADGVGLGLSIVKMIAEAHGGTLRVRSTVGKGTEFDILLAEAGQASRPPAPVGLGSGSGAR
ncbi:MAG: sensor histidine kinase [Chloroflexi bacterium]|nr:MAG: sensor histidine kinase [Chloroflexota bacterium]